MVFIPASIRRLLLCLIGLILVTASVAEIVRIRDEARRRLDQTRKLLDKQDRIEFDKEIRLPLDADGISLLQSRKNVKSIVRFANSYFVATDGGLVELSAEGKFLRRFSVL